MANTDLPPPPPLRLLAKDVDDLQILVAHLQDSLMSITSMIYDRNAKTFTFLANRHCWEHQSRIYAGAHLRHRVHSGICFHAVKAVHHRGFHPKGHMRTLNLLTIQQKTVDNTTDLHLVFSGINEIRLQVDKIHCRLGDIGHPWPTRKHPMHVYEHIATATSL